MKNFITNFSKKQKARKSPSMYIPEDVLENILSRLPARKVGEFRTVCKGWNALTSTKNFKKMHFQYNQYPSELLIPSMSLNSFYLNSSESSCSLSDKRIFKVGCSNNNEDLFDLHKLSVFNGFIVGNEDQNYTILNPVTWEKLKLTVPYGDAKLELDGQVYAIFMHPKLEEICILWGQKNRSSPETTEFQLLNLKSTTNSGVCRWRSIIPRLHKYTPRRNINDNNVSPPVIHNNILYWMIQIRPRSSDHFCCEEAILAFDVQTEEFQKLSHPGQYCADRCEASVKHGRMHLLNTKRENISVIEFCEKAPFINVWEWERRSSKWSLKIRIKAKNSYRDEFENYKVFGMVDEVRVLLQGRTSVYSELYILNLKQGTWKSFEYKSREILENIMKKVSVFTYTPTFATITTDGGEVEVRVPSGMQDIRRLKNVIY